MRFFIYIFFLIVLASCNVMGHGPKKKKNDEAGFSNPTAQRHDPITVKQSLLEETFTAGLIQKSIGNPAQALVSFQTVLKMDPKCGAADYEIAGIMQQQGNFSDAVQYAKNAVDNDPQNKWYDFRYGELLEANGRHDESIKIFKDLSDKDPMNTDLLFRLADEQKRAGKYDDALKTYNKIQSIEGISDTLANEKIALFEITGNKEAEKSTLETLVKYFPTKENYARIVDFKEKNHLDYEFDLVDWQKNYPNDIRPQLKIAELEMHSDALSDRPRGFELAMNAFQFYPEGENEKIKFLAKNYPISDSTHITGEKKKQADSLCAILRKIYPDDPGSFYISGDYFYNEGQLDKAVKNYSKAIVLGETEYLPWKRTMEIYFSESAYDSAQKYCNKALEIFPLQPDPYYFLGSIFYAKKEFKKAASYLQSGLDMAPGDVLLNERMGDTQYRLDNADAAMTFWKKAKDGGGKGEALERKIRTGKMEDKE
ncbi:MAG: tetratricopeptide repeat protein [Bacteroidetes bacterium]|nr:tetratricopeptide repeat protein [Bacteroidota bacterium]